MATPRHGKITSVKIGTLATPSVLVDISSYLTQAELQRPTDTPETTAFQSPNKTYVVGIPDSQIPLSGNFDPVLDAILAALIGSDVPVSVEYGPEGTAVGRIKYTGTYYVSAYNVTNPVAGKVDFSATLMPASGVTRGTF